MAPKTFMPLSPDLLILIIIVVLSNTAKDFADIIKDIIMKWRAYPVLTPVDPI